MEIWSDSRFLVLDVIQIPSISQRILNFANSFFSSLAKLPAGGMVLEAQISLLYSPYWVFYYLVSVVY